MVKLKLVTASFYLRLDANGKQFYLMAITSDNYSFHESN